MTPLQRDYRSRSAVDHDIWQQMPVLYAHARHPGARIIELGVRGGNSTSAFLAGTEHSGGEVWSVDIAEPDVPEYWRALPNWHLLVADDQSQEAVAFCPDNVDVLFIDTSHYYEHTLTELRLYAGKVRPGGVVLLHDTDKREWPDVSRALNDFCGAAGLDWYEHPFWHGLGVLEVPRA